MFKEEVEKFISAPLNCPERHLVPALPQERPCVSSCAPNKSKHGSTKLVDQLEHARAAFENARTQDELLGSILDLKGLVRNHQSLRTNDLKQALILSGQLKKSKSSFWDKKVALAFGGLLKVFSLTDHLQHVGKAAFSAAQYQSRPKKH